MAPPKVGTGDITQEPKVNRFLRERLRDAALGIESIVAGGTNAHFKYKFVEEAEVVAAVREALFKHDILFTVDMLDVTQTRFERTTVTMVKLKLSYVDIHNGTTLDSTWFGESHDTGDKGINKAIVSAIKYFFLKTLLIPKAGDDAEADPNTDRVATAPPQRPAAPPAAPQAPRPQTPRPAPAGAESPERLAAREAFYKAMKECNQSASVENIKKMAVEALNLPEPPRSLFNIGASDFDAMTQWVYDNYAPGVSFPADDNDIPF